MPPRGNYFASAHFQERRRNARLNRQQQQQQELALPTVGPTQGEELIPGLRFIGIVRDSIGTIQDSLASTTAGRMGLSVLSSPLMSFMTDPEFIEMVDQSITSVRSFVSDFVETIHWSDAPTELDNQTIQILEGELIEYEDDFDGTVIEWDLEEASSELQNSNRPQKRTYEEMKEILDDPQATKRAPSVDELSNGGAPFSRAFPVQCITKYPTGLDG